LRFAFNHYIADAGSGPVSAFYVLGLDNITFGGHPLDSRLGLSDPGSMWKSYLDHTVGMMRLIPLFCYTVADIEKEIGSRSNENEKAG
jgi:hypothetical protein